MKRLTIALALLLVPSFAWAQCTGVFPNNYVCGNVTGSSKPPRGIPFASAPSGALAVGTTTVTGGTSTYLLYNNAGVLGNETLASLLVSPPPIGGTTPNTGAFTTLNIGGALYSNSLFTVNGSSYYNVTNPTMSTADVTFSTSVKNVAVNTTITTGGTLGVGLSSQMTVTSTAPTSGSAQSVTGGTLTQNASETYGGFFYNAWSNTGGTGSALLAIVRQLAFSSRDAGPYGMWVASEQNSFHGQAAYMASHSDAAGAGAWNYGYRALNPQTAIMMGDSFLSQGGVSAFRGRYARGTNASPAAVQVDDVLLRMEGLGFGATDFSNPTPGAAPAQITLNAAGTWTDTSQPSYINMFVTAAASLTPISALKINSDKSIVASGLITAQGYALTATAWSVTAPTVASGFCSTGSPVTALSASNGTAAFDILIGAATCGSTGTLTMPASTTGWVCAATDVTTPASHNIVQTGTNGSTTAVVLTDYARVAGTAQNFLAGDHVHVMCTGY
jgi:hypothetical protein